MTMQGKVCLITGATSGIGLVTARELARQGARVALVGRSPIRIETALAYINTTTGNQNVEGFCADLSSQGQIHELGRQFHQRYSRLDVLINNAGGLWLQRELTEDGIEMTVAVNHLAYFLLSNLLSPILQASSPARIVNVASNAHCKAILDFENLMGERDYRGWRQYCRTKLMNVLCTYELSLRLKGTGVTVNALHPGWVSTGFAGNNGWRGRLWQWVTRFLAISPEQGAQTPVYVASSPEVAGITGCYFAKQQTLASSPASYNEETRRRLWNVSEQLTGSK
jgi:NAD(P)-dependent dehydrogenase (short-subunit alcohol dehydrogenase family)